MRVVICRTVILIADATSAGYDLAYSIEGRLPRERSPGKTQVLVEQYPLRETRSSFNLLVYM